MLTGLFWAVFATIALTGPGRIDIVDGQTRYEVGRSLVDYGDLAVRNPEAWFNVSPGRGGAWHTNYRLPQSLIAAASVLAADATGPSREGRRHFFFALHGAVLAGALAVLYARWFRRRGLSPAAATGWAAAGIVCTPNWYYATSTFDDFLGACVCVAALVVGYRAGAGGGLAWCVLAGLLVGAAFDCKPPLAVILIPVLAAAGVTDGKTRIPFLRGVIIVAGLGVGAIIHVATTLYKFPGDVATTLGEPVVAQLGTYVNDPLRVLTSAAELVAGPASGALWYAPATLLGIIGLAVRARDGERRLVQSAAVAAIVFLAFFVSLPFYKGDPAWGPRYLTPLFAVAWLYAPDAIRLVRARTAAVLILGGFLLQTLGLAVDPQRLYIDRGISPGFALQYPILHYDPRLSHLLNRPREIVETWSTGRAPEFTPMREPTTATLFFLPSDPDLDRQMALRRAVVKRYQVFSGPRFWWAVLPYLEVDRRPIDLTGALTLFAASLIAGLGLIAAGLAGSQSSTDLTASASGPRTAPSTKSL